MDLNDTSLSKLYYSIGEVAKMFDVNPSLIRFWEGEFTVIKPKKNKKGNRMFTQKDIENFRKIYILVKEKGFTLDGAKKALKSKDESLFQPNQEDQLVHKLQDIKNKLMTLKASL